MPRNPTRIAALVLLAGAAACSDRSPLGVNGFPSPHPAAVTKVRCTARVKARTVECAAPSTGGARGTLFVGGQNVYVRLTSANTAYDGQSSFTSEVTLQNLMRQPMGTADGTTADPAGNLVFFAEGPTVTDGTGTVTVEKADSLGIFLSSNQPAYRYPGILAPEQVSAPRTWTFAVPPTVDAFTFVVYVATRLPNETGWMDLGPPNPHVPVGGSLALGATPRTAAGAATGAAVHWSAADSLVARVDSLGVVTGVAPGTTRIFASDGARLDSLTVTVAPAAGDQTAPNLLALAFSARTANTAAGPAGVTLTVHVSDFGAGTASIGFTFRTPAGGTLSDSGCAQDSGDANDGVWSCTVDLPVFSPAGEYVLEEVTLHDAGGNPNAISTADLTRAGMPASIHVESVNDTDGPLLTAFSAAVDSIDVGAGPVGATFTVEAADSLTGVQGVAVTLTSPTGAQAPSGACTLSAGFATAGTYDCTVDVPQWVEPGNWSLSVTLIDNVGNTRVYTAGDLASLGFPSQVHVASVYDGTAAVVTGLTRAPSPVVVTDSTGADLTVTVTAADSVSGVAQAAVVLKSPTGVVVSGSCGLTAGDANAGTWTCIVGIPAGAEAGTWTVDEVVLVDTANNVGDYTGAQLSAFTTTFQVQKN